MNRSRRVNKRLSRFYASRCSFKSASLLIPGTWKDRKPHIYKKNAYISYAFFLNQRLPILPGGCPPSTFGVCGLNCCVRHGNRWIPAAIATELLSKGPCPYNCIKRISLTSLCSSNVFLCICFQIPSPTPYGSKRFSSFCASCLALLQKLFSA